jgi:hypothetical protein
LLSEFHAVHVCVRSTGEPCRVVMLFDRKFYRGLANMDDTGYVREVLGLCATAVDLRLCMRRSLMQYLDSDSTAADCVVAATSDIGAQRCSICTVGALQSVTHHLQVHQVQAHVRSEVGGRRTSEQIADTMTSLQVTLMQLADRACIVCAIFSGLSAKQFLATVQEPS